MINEQTNATFNKLLIHPNFKDTVSDIKKVGMAVPPISASVNIDLQHYAFPPNGELVTPVEDISVCDLDSKKGEKLSQEGRSIAAYDESINKFMSLEGMTYFTSHSLILLAKNDFLPINLLTLYFYTRSKDISNKCSYVKYSEDPDMDSKKDYIKDKINFLEQNTPSKALLFIDGPLIGGDVYTFMIHAIKRFLEKDIIPIFFVKNSSSNLVTENTGALKNKFNSDMHWAFKYLKAGQRTNFFKYADKNNIKNAKIFCYFKSFNVSPQRVELHVDTYEKYMNLIPSIMDLIHYLLLVQGDRHNPQIRPIAIAEKFARDTLRMVDFNNMMHSAGIVPTMNQERFAW